MRTGFALNNQMRMTHPFITVQLNRASEPTRTVALVGPFTIELQKPRPKTKRKKIKNHTICKYINTSKDI